MGKSLWPLPFPVAATKRRGLTDKIVSTAQTMSNLRDFSHVHAVRHTDLSCFVQNICSVPRMHAVYTYMYLHVLAQIALYMLTRLLLTWHTLDFDAIG